MAGQYAIEVDVLSKWKEGLGQASHYGDVADAIPVLAVIAPEGSDGRLLDHIEKLCTSKGVKLIRLLPQ